MRIVLIRHAEPHASASLDPTEWPLSSAGRRATQRLRSRLPPAEAIWVASEELKARQTLQCLDPEGRQTILQDERFNEVRRDEPYDGDFRTRRLAWIEGKLDGQHANWETAHGAAGRFDAAVRTYAQSGTPVVIGSHGMIITAWLVAQGRVGPGEDASRFWRSLRFPDMIDIEVD